MGTVEVDVAGRPIALGRRQERYLLGLLLLEPNRAVPVDRLVELLWTDPGPGASATLRTYCARLRTSLRPTGASLRRAGSGYLVEVDPLTVDLHRFTKEVTAAAQLPDPRHRADALASALALWRGPLLAGVADEALRARVATTFEETHARAVEQWAEAELDAGRPDVVVAPLRALLASNPYRERAVELLMLALYRGGQQAEALHLYRQTRATVAGRRSEALRLYRNTRKVMIDQLGIEPGPALRRIHEAILRGDEQLLTGSSPTPAIATAGTAAPKMDTAGTSAPEVLVPRQLPPDVPGFVGRAGLLRELDGMLPSAAGGAVGPVVITGTAGVGKTALTVHWAHRIAGRYPDGQLHIDLRGYAPSGPLRPIDALAAFLRALGQPNSQIPIDVGEAAAQYRTLMADRRILVVLDNARSADQVRPLLPGEPNCLALITSRHRLSGLIARDGARRVSLRVLTALEAHALLGGIIGAARTTAEPAATRDLARACAFLPLALRIAAAHIAEHVGRTIADHVARLSAGDPVGALAVADDEASAVSVAFDLSYRVLPEPAQLMFRRFGLLPLPDLTPAAAAALADVDEPPAAELLDRLADCHLLDQHTTGRYTTHDLLRRFAHNLADEIDNPADRTSALNRLYDHLWANVHNAAELIAPELQRLPTDRPAQDRFPHADAALVWLDANLANIVATILHAAHRAHPISWQLADALRGFLWLRNNTIDWLTIAEAGLRAAEQARQLQAQAAMHLSLGLARQATGENHLAITENTTAVELCRAAGWTSGEASVLGNLGIAYAESGQPRKAIASYDLALTLHQRTGRRVGEALTLANLANLHRDSGRLHTAADYYQRALAAHRTAGSGAAQGYALCGLGDILRQLGQLTTATALVSQALELARRVSSHDGQIMALHHLAAIHRDLGDHHTALHHAHAAYELSEQNWGNYSGAMVHNMLASITARTDDLDTATHLYQRALSMARAAGGGYPEVTALLGLAETALKAQENDEATTHLATALDLAHRSEYRLLEAQALNLLAKIRHIEGRHDDAADLIRQAQTIHAEIRDNTRAWPGRHQEREQDANSQSGPPVTR